MHGQPSDSPRSMPKNLGGAEMRTELVGQQKLPDSVLKNLEDTEMGTRTLVLLRREQT